MNAVVTPTPAAAGISMRSLHTPEEMVRASALLARVWEVPPQRSLLSPEMLVALAHSGNYVAGAFLGEEIIGVNVGFFHPPLKRSLHSHVAAVAPEHAGAGVGRALKHHQRLWALERDATRVTWTFDPLVARNAYFNIRKLGCDVEAYLTDFYGTMQDSVNQGQYSDRLLVVWHLDRLPRDNERPQEDHPVLLRNDDGRPVMGAMPDGTEYCLVEIPSDIDEVRRHLPALALEWRIELREVLGGLLAEGWRVVHFDPDGSYHLRRSA
ncbi:GNAT family N-acetyltransferase [Streptomyces niveus]|uniref:GNAT family N-acetyltransferase n=1 Tax=Streptomyces niveus TaxID=193462 RepID=UPI0036D2A45D